LTELRALGNIAQGVEVDVGTREHVDKRFIGDLVLSAVALETRQRHRTGGLGDRASVVENVLDRRADLVGGDGHDVIQPLVQDAEVLIADAFDRHALGKQAGVGQVHRAACLLCCDEAGGLLRLHTDDLYLVVQLLEQDRHTGSQATAPDGDEDAVNLGYVLENFQADGPLSSNDRLVVEGGDEDHALGLGELDGLRLGLVEVAAVQQHTAAQPLNRGDLDLRGDLRHHDGGLDTKLAAGQGHPLRGVTGGGGAHAPSALLRAQLSHAVESAANRETVHRLQVLALDEHAVI